MGSHPKLVNPRDLEEVIKKFCFPDETELKEKFKLDVEVCSQAVCIYKGEEIDWKVATRAAHIHVALDNNRKVSARILRIFSLANELGFPLGHEYWFVPNTIDSRIPSPK